MRLPRPLRWFRRLPLRSRLALLTAAAVAFAVAVVSVICWFLVEQKLYDEVDSQLTTQLVKGDVTLNDVVATFRNCSPRTPRTIWPGSGTLTTGRSSRPTARRARSPTPERCG